MIRALYFKDEKLISTNLPLEKIAEALLESQQPLVG